MHLKLSKGKKCPWETKELSLPVSLLAAGKTCSAKETGLVSLLFVGTCGWSQQGKDSAWRGVMGINALLEMGNLEKVWVISCLSLPSHLGAMIPGDGMGEEK